MAINVPNFEAQFARFRDDLYLGHGDAPFNSFGGAAKAWEGYKLPLRDLALARLDPTGLTGARHIDAHSFCWMLIKMEDVTSGRSKVGTVRYAGARTKHIFRIAYTAAQTAAASGKQYTATRKDKEIHHNAQELQAIISRLLKEQGDLCALTNLPLQWPEEGDDPAFFASLDRIDSSGHYSDVNLQVVCRFVNGWKSDTADGEFRRLLAIVKASQTSDSKAADA